MGNLGSSLIYKEKFTKEGGVLIWCLIHCARLVTLSETIYIYLELENTDARHRRK